MCRWWLKNSRHVVTELYVPCQVFDLCVLGTGPPKGLKAESEVMRSVL